jgi:PAS domain S-box-containing protein
MPEPTDEHGALRQRAEQRLHDEPESPDALAPEEAQRLLHELRVYQIELDLQNAELRRTQEELTTARDRYIDLYDFAPVGYLTISRDTHILQANLTSARLLGVARHDMIGKLLFRFIAKAGQEDYHFLRQRLEQSDAPQMVELPLVKADGTKWWARLDAIATREAPIDAAQDTPVFRMTMTDITDRKRTEETNAHQTAETAATMASLADGLVVVNPAGAIIRMNDAAAHLLGYTLDTHALPLADHLHTLRVEAFDGGMYPPDELPTARALHGDTTKGALMVLHHPDRTVWVLASAAPIRMPDGQQVGAVATFTDITPLHDLQEQQLLLHLVSHDLRTPLAVVSGYTSVIADKITELGIDGDIVTSLHAIQRGVKRMTTMIEDLTEMARVEGGQLQLKPEPVAMAAYLQDFLQRSSAVFDVARIQVDIAAELPPVLADYDRLDRILSNLLSNALKYSDAGTSVLVRNYVQDGAIVVSVTDHGRGIPPDDVLHLFQRFYRAKGERRAEGIGLGLYITRILVEAHGGHIWVESEVGKGSTFFVALPMASREEPA